MKDKNHSKINCNSLEIQNAQLTAREMIEMYLLEEKKKSLDPVHIEN